ncbi:PREDICTED: uncharacterized protein LOC109217615 [Nicotiana attenuata]|uniref:uncharacterized protein LOC109217615 n=1 Tax=Nicotiana attenuata TaxID=49451 RepID=UPI000904DAD3|nr:PREDICTED: uncharacterized protein LOC109217615 [Nicotiana attenuata]
MPDRFNPEKPYSIELILQDAKKRLCNLAHIITNDYATGHLCRNDSGDRIQASIGKYVIKFFTTKIHELGLYRMNYFVVVPNNLSLKNTPHNLRLTFTQRTTVEEIVDSSFHMNIFNFRPFDQVVKYEDVKTHKQGDNDSVFLNVQLEDDQRNRITATLWSELVDHIQPYLNGAIDESLIVVLQFMKPQKFRGNYSVRSCWYSTKLRINSTLPQYVEFKSRLVATCPSNCERITQTSSQQSYSVRDELAKVIISFKTITDLVQCGEECTYWIAAKLVNLELERGWSYLACNKCTKKVDKIGNIFL